MNVLNKWPVWAGRVSLILLLFLSVTAHGQVGKTLLGESQWGPVHLDTCYTSGKEEPFHLGKSPFWQKIGERGGQMTSIEAEQFEAMKTATIIIEFGDGFDDLGADAQAARDAFRFAADIWETEVVSVVPIIIAADFASLGGGVLGQNGSPSVTNVPNAPDPSTNYTLALANAIAGFDLAPGTPNGNQTYNTDFNFYFGTDGNTPSGITDFTTVVLHEIGHSMGISGISNGGAGVGANGGANPRSWDLLVELGDGTPILDLGFGSPEQQDALVSGDLFINGPLAVAALGGVRPEIYAPASFSPGSSYSHWDENAFPAGDPNSLMTPFVGSGESNFDIGDITRGVLADQGWQLSSDLETQDVGVIAINTPVSDSDLGATEIVEITVRNFGIEEATGFTVSYSVDGGTPVSEAFPGTIPAVSISTFAFTQPVDLSSDGTTYTISAFTDFGADQDLTNDSTATIISNLIPSAEIPVASIDFGNIGVGNSATLPVKILNTAVGTLAGELDIDSISVEIDEFSAQDPGDFPITILPGDSTELLFTYSPDALEANSATATVYTNAGEFEVSLSGSGTEPSNISVDPLILSSTLELGESESQFIEISNTGVATLDFTLSFEAAVDTAPEAVAAPFQGTSKAINTSALQSRKVNKSINLLSSPEMEFLGADDAVYTIDDGTSESNIGLETLNELMWLNAFQVAPGANVITSISSAVASGSAETPARFILYEDPDDDGDPSNAVYLTETSGILTNPGEDIFTTVSIDPTPVEGVFFVAVLIVEDPSVNSFPMPQDSDSPSQQSSWAISDSDGDFDVFDLTNNSLTPLLIDDAGLGGNWLLRADGQFFSASPVAASAEQGETVEVQVDFFGTAPGNFNSLININSNDPDEPVVSVEANLEVNGVLISASPESLFESLPQGGTSTQTLTLINGGSSDVSFDIIVEDLGIVTPGSDSTLSQRGHNPVFKREVAYEGAKLDISSSEAILTDGVLELGTVQYGTGFEDFLTGDINTQNGWSGQFANWTIETTNPSEDALHFRGLSDGLGQSLAFSPTVSIGSESLSSVRMDLEVAGTGATWQIIPQSPTAASVNTRIQINPDGTVSALVDDPSLGTVFEPIGASVPAGYFTLRLEVERASSQFSIYFDDELVFEGQGFAGDIEQLVILSLMEVSGPTFDMDNVAIIDGSAEGGNPSFITPEVFTGIIPGGGSIDIDMAFDANLDFGTYRSDLRIGFNDNPLVPQLVVEAELVVEGPPLLDVSPTVIIEELEFGASSSRILSLENTGGEAVDYDLSIIGATVDALQSEGSLIGDQNSVLMDRATLEKKAYDDEQSALSSVPKESTPIFSVIGDIILEETFEGDSFPSTGWEVIDNEGTGVVWSFAVDAGEANYTSTGEAATVSSDAFGPAEFDTELRTPAIDIAGKSDIFIQYSANYQNLAGLDFLDLDVSTDGGTTWTTVLSWNEDHGGFFGLPGELVTLSLDEFVEGASTMVLRWRYYDPNSGDFDWYAQVDDVVIYEEAEMWLSIDQPSGSIPVGTTLEVPVNFDASLLNGGDFKVAGIIVNSNSVNAPEVGVIAAIDVKEPAEAEISATELSETLVEGTTSEQSFTIQNNGESDLSFDFQDIFFNADPVEFVGEIEQAEHRKTFIPIEDALQPDPRLIQNTIFDQKEEVSSNQYATDFEGFLLGDITGQSGWAGQFGNWVASDINPFGRAQHIQSLSDGLGTTLAFSPEVAIGSEPTSSVVMQVNLMGSGVTWDIIPQSTSAAFVNTIVRFNLDGTIAVLNEDSVDGVVFSILPTEIPEGYFEVGIEVDRASATFSLAIDGNEVFAGQGFAGDIEQLVFRSLMEVEGPTFDVDNIQIIDGEIFDPFVSVSPQSGTLTTGQSVNIDVFFDAQNVEPGTYNENLVLFTNDPEKEEVLIPATLEVLELPSISVSPEALEITMLSGSSTSEFINVENLGDAALTFTASTSSSSLLLGTLSDTVAGKSFVEVELIASYDTTGVFADSIIFTSNDPENPEVAVPVLVTVYPASGAIIGFNVINTTSNEVVGPLSDGGSINANSAAPGFSIEALTYPDEVGSVVFELDGEKIQTESYAPYAIAGDGNGRFNPLYLKEGIYTLTAIPFGESSGNGDEGQELTVTFEVFNSDSIISFDLIDARKDVSLGELVDGAVIDLADNSTKRFSIEAFASPEHVGSVVFELNGEKIYTDNFARYSAAGNFGNNFRRLFIGRGDYVLTATPYSIFAGLGVAGNSLSVSFTVIDSKHNSQSIGAFPNPMVGNGLTIDLHETTDENVEVQIVDLEGREFYHTIDESLFERSHIRLEEVSDSMLNAGVYLIKVSIGGDVKTVRLLKN